MDHGIQFSGGKAKGVRFAQLVPVATGQAAAQGDRVGRRCLASDGKVEHRLRFVPVGVDLRVGEHTCLAGEQAPVDDGQVVGQRLWVHGTGEGDTHRAVRLSVALSIEGSGLEYAGILDRPEFPRVGIERALRAARGQRALGDDGTVLLVQFQRLVRLKDHHLVVIVVIPAEGAGHGLVTAGKGQLKVILGGSVIHGLVEGNGHSRVGADIDGVVSRIGADDGRQPGGESPDTVFGQDAAGGVGQTSSDAGGVGRGRSKAVVRRKDIDRGIEPLTLARHRWVEGERLRQIDLLSDAGQRHHRPVEHDGDASVHVHLFGAVGWLGGCHLQVADGGKAQVYCFAEGEAVGAGSLFVHGHAILGGPVKGFAGLEDQRPLIGPLESALQLWLDGKGRLHGGSVHRLVEGENHRPIQRLLLTTRRGMVSQAGRHRRQRSGCIGRCWRRWRGVSRHGSRGTGGQRLHGRRR